MNDRKAYFKGISDILHKRSTIGLLSTNITSHLDFYQSFALESRPENQNSK